MFFAVNSALNRNSLSRLPRSELNDTSRFLISILIPCRNEQDNIGKCLDSFLKQTYSNFEIIVLDDESDDDTGNILTQYMARHPNISVIQGKPLPEGWTGKNWACHQLYEASEGEVLLYCDADTTVDSTLTNDALAELVKRNLGFITIFPQRESTNLFDRCVWSFTRWVIASWVPLWLAYQTRTRIFAVGFGQFLMLRRTAYDEIGGYESLRANSLDDFEIARRIQSSGTQWRVYNGIGRLMTVSYQSTKDAVEGYGKSIFPALGSNAFVLLLSWLLLANLTWTPVLVLVMESVKIISLSTDQLQLASFSVAAVLISWAAAAVKLKISTPMTVLYPIAITSVLYTSLASYIGIRYGTMMWKNRVIHEADEVLDRAARTTDANLESVSDTPARNSEP